MKRRVPVHLVVTALALLALPAAATAAPTVTLKGKAVPIPGFPHTGNFFGAGAAIHAEYTIHGTEYGGFPAPLIGVTASLPKGVKLHPRGFATCPPKLILEERTPERCPRGSEGWSRRNCQRSRVVRQRTCAGDRRTLRLLHPGHRDRVLHGWPFAGVAGNPIQRADHEPQWRRRLWPEARRRTALGRTVPVAPDASVESIKVTLGAAYRKGGKTSTTAGFQRPARAVVPVKSVLTFAENGEIGRPVSVTAFFKAPCPKS